jgi:hypothetical protein
VAARKSRVEGFRSSRELLQAGSQTAGKLDQSLMFLVGQAGKAGSTLGPCRSRNLERSCHQGVCSRLKLEQARAKKGRRDRPARPRLLHCQRSKHSRRLRAPTHPPLSRNTDFSKPARLSDRFATPSTSPIPGSSFIALGALFSRHWLAAVVALLF